jgi:glycine cleavage system H protein
MRINECEFPDDRMYDREGLVWVEEEGEGVWRVGGTSVLAAIAGKLDTIRAKPAGARYARGRVIGTLEGGRYFGAIRAPFEGTLVAVNGEVLARPKLLSNAPYGEGWFARMRPTGPEELKEAVWQATEAADTLRALIEALHVRCFAAIPDYEMYEIGSECAAVLAHLDELLARAVLGEVVHLVSDDATAPIEMVRWSMQTGHKVVESRKEGNLYHFLVRKER